MKKSKIAFIGIVVLAGMNGCRSRYFPDRSAAVQFLNSHRQGFEATAEEWARTIDANPTSCFCNFREGNYRWKRAFIKASGAGYTVELNGQSLTAPSLESAAELAGASTGELTHWIDLSNQYKIYCIQPGADGAVEILLAGSDWSPYGFRYVPAGNDRTAAALKHYAGHRGVDNTDQMMLEVGDRWFYFEAKR